jgi:hypothetical protein
MLVPPDVWQDLVAAFTQFPELGQHGKSFAEAIEAVANRAAMIIRVFIFSPFRAAP